LTEADHDHSHDHGHHHWDPMAGEVNADYLTELLEAQEQAMQRGIQHLTAELNALKEQHARCVEALDLRYAEQGRKEDDNDSTGTAGRS
jgi:hypothetical protein